MLKQSGCNRDNPWGDGSIPGLTRHVTEVTAVTDSGRRTGREPRLCRMCAESNPVVDGSGMFILVRAPCGRVATRQPSRSPRYGSG